MKGFQIQQRASGAFLRRCGSCWSSSLLAVQIGFVVAISYFMQEYLALAYGVVQVGALFLAVHIYNEPVSFLISSSGSSCFCWPRRWV